MLRRDPAPLCALRSYASYCANIARTYFVNPSEEQQAAYVAVQAAHAAAVAALVDGAPMSAAYSAAVRVLQVSRAYVSGRTSNFCATFCAVLMSPTPARAGSGAAAPGREAASQHWDRHWPGAARQQPGAVSCKRPACQAGDGFQCVSGWVVPAGTLRLAGCQFRADKRVTSCFFVSLSLHLHLCVSMTCRHRGPGAQ